MRSFTLHLADLSYRYAPKGNSNHDRGMQVMVWAVAEGQ